MLQLQNIILDMLTGGIRLVNVADRLCNEIETLLPDVVCSVVTVDDDGVLHPLAGANVPKGIGELVEGLPVGENSGSCGAAVYLRAPVAVTDIASDPRWIGYSQPALDAGLLACWSSPILNGLGDPIGAFGLYFRDRRGPTRYEQRIVGTAVHLLALAIERHELALNQDRRASTETVVGMGSRTDFTARLAELPCTLPPTWALLLVELDDLNTVNDRFGARTADRLIVLAGERIAASVVPDKAYRLGVKEFAIIVESAAALNDVVETAARITAAIARPVVIGGETTALGGTIGGASLLPGDENAVTVQQNADQALSHAKTVSRGGFVNYWAGLGTKMASRASAIVELETALLENRIDAYYQPVVCLDTRAIKGFEALCRLKTPNGAIVSAAAFHEAISDPKIAQHLTNRMLHIVAADLSRWIESGIDVPQISVNVSSVDIHSGTLEQTLCEAFEDAGVPLKHIIVEVTETVHMDRRAHAVRRVLDGLRAKGLRVALDDFGTGYASLTHLLEVPVDTIKIDGTFVRRLEPFNDSAAIVQGLIAIAQALGIQVIAEGIETEAQLKQLQIYGCGYGQGYLFSKAVDRDAATTLMLASGPSSGPPGGTALRRRLPRDTLRDIDEVA